MVIGLTDDVTTCDHTCVGIRTQLRCVYMVVMTMVVIMASMDHPLGVGPSRTT